MMFYNENNRKVNNLLSIRGGKSLIASEIVKYFPPHKTYIEPFCGANWVLFHKDPKTSKLEVINDKDEHIINFWRVVRDRPYDLWKAVRWDVPSRAEYERMKALDPENLDEIERARWLYWVLKGSFGGAKRSSFGTGLHRRSKLKFDKFIFELRQCNKRLKSVVIECLDYKDLKEKYDSEQTLWYCDPPYNDSNTLGYVDSFDINEFVDFCISLKGLVIISHKDDSFIREIFYDWSFIELGSRLNCIPSYCENVEERYTKELLITNFKPKKQLALFDEGFNNRY